MNQVTDKHTAAVAELFAPYEMAWPGEAALTLAKHCPDYTEAVRKLRAALSNLVTVNEEWNAAVQTIIKKPPGWNDDYLDAARTALEETKEFAE